MTSLGYESYLKGLEVPSVGTEYGDPSSDDLSSEWDTDDPDPPPTPTTKVLFQSSSGDAREKRAGQ